MIEYVSRNKIINKFKFPSSLVLIDPKDGSVSVATIIKEKKKILMNIYKIGVKASLPKLEHSFEFDSLNCLLDSEKIFKKMNYRTMKYVPPRWPIISNYNDPPMSIRQEKSVENYFDKLLSSKFHAQKRKNLVWNVFMTYNGNSEIYKNRLDKLKKVAKIASEVSLSIYNFISTNDVKAHDLKTFAKWNEWDKLLKISKNNNPANEILFYNVFNN